MAVAAAAAHRALRPGAHLVVVTPSPQGILGHLLSGFAHVDEGEGAEGARDGRVLLRSRTAEEEGHPAEAGGASASRQAGDEGGGGGAELSQSMIPPGIYFRLSVVERVGGGSSAGRGAEGGSIGGAGGGGRDRDGGGTGDESATGDSAAILPQGPSVVLLQKC